MIAEAEQECPIARIQDFLQEFLQIAMMPLHKAVLTPAYIRDQAQRQRQIGAMGEIGNRLWRAVVEDIEIVFGKIGHQRSRGIADGERHIDKTNVHSKGGGFLSCTTRENQKEGK